MWKTVFLKNRYTLYPIQLYRALDENETCVLCAHNRMPEHGCYCQTHFEKIHTLKKNLKIS